MSSPILDKWPELLEAAAELSKELAHELNIAKDDIIRYLDKVPTWVWIALATVGTLELLGAIIYLLGFTEGGVALGSLAAAWQSAIGNVGKGSFFAFLQAIGTGRWKIWKALWPYAAAAVALAAAAIFGKKKKPESEATEKELTKQEKLMLEIGKM